MNGLRRWVDPTGLRAAVLLAFAAALANGAWILLDHTAPSWDQASYLDATWHYQQALADGGIGGLLDSIQSVDPKRGPLFGLALLPFFYVLDDVTRSGLLLNLILAPVLYLAAGEIAMHVFRNWRARLLTIAFVATMPLLVGLLHNNLQDFLLTTLATVSLLFLLKSRLFRHRGMSLALGATAGLGTLTKVTFPAFLAGPLLVVIARLAIEAWDKRRTGRTADLQLGRVGVNLGAAAAIYCALVLPWYLTNLTPTIEYVESTTGGPLSEGVGPSDPLSFDAIFSFSVEMVNHHLSWIIGLAGLVAICLNWRRIAALVSPSVRLEPLTGVAFLLAWILVPYLSLALGHNQDVRLMAPAMPGFAIVAAGAIAAIELPRVRLALAAVSVLALTYVTINHITPLRPDFVPREVTLDLGAEQAVVLLDSRVVGYEAPPGDDYATPIFRYLEQRARTPGGDEVGPRSVCLLQSDPVVNYNTFRFLSDERGDPFELRELVLGPEGRRGLARAVSECDFALYAPLPPLPPGTEDQRAALVNVDTASHYMTPELLSLFERPARQFPVSKSALSNDLFEDYNGISADRVQVLVRRPAGS